MIDLNGKSVVIFGGSGFIGCHLAERLLGLGARVLIADRYAPRDFSNPSAVKIDFIKTDIRDTLAIKKALGNKKYVFNLAASLPFSSGQKDYLKNSIDINLSGAVNIGLTCCQKRVKKLIFTSGYVVYGIPCYLPIDEAHSTEPIDIYGASKLAAEKYLGALSRKIPSLETVILRLATVYGPRQVSKGLIPNLVKAALRSSQVVINAQGREKRDYLFIDDAVDSLVLSLGSNINGVFNIGSGGSISANQVKDIIEDLSGRRLKAGYSKKTGLLPEILLSNKLARLKLNYKPRITIRKGLGLTYRWCKDNLYRKGR